MKKYTGKDLIAWGIKPSKYFKNMLNFINDPRNQETYIVTESDAKGWCLATEELDNYKPPVIKPYDYPISYHLNIEASNPDEEENLLKVIETMDIVMTTPTVVGGAVMPDACPTGPAGQIPVGGVVVTKNAIHPGMHSSDVCCSVMATNFGKINPKLVSDIAIETTHFGPGGRKEHGGWENILYDNKPLADRILDNFFTKDYIVKAAKHMGTQGDGNHFLYVGISKNTGDTMLVTHHGSRGFGASVYKKGMDVAEKFRRQLSPDTPKENAWIPYEELEGLLYWDALQICRDWTKLNHQSIHNKIGNKLKVQYLDRFWNEHNFVFKDGDLFYHAKGATPLSDKFVPDSQDGLRLVPLNMGEPILVVKGDSTANNLGFAPHGAGRNTSRAEHHRRNTKLTKAEIFKKETKGLDVRFYTGQIDISELPSAYKNAPQIKAQIEKFGLGTVVDEIMPYGCIMAGEIIYEKKKKKLAKYLAN